MGREIMNKKKIDAFIKKVKFDEKGLVHVIVQDYNDKKVLMIAYMNKKSLRITLQEGKTCFWSRSRNKLWRKGEQSGNQQIIKKIYIDCDGDCLLILAKQIGGAACHTGYRSCFYRTMKTNGSIVVSGKKIFDPSKVY